MIATNGLLFSGLALADAVSEFREAGFEGFELPHPVFYKGIFRGTAPEEVRPLVEALRDVDLGGLKIVSVNAGNDFLKPDEREFSEELRRTKVVIDTAEELGVGLVRVFAGEPKEGMTSRDCRDLAVRALREVTGYAERLDKVLALENHGRYSNNFDEELAILRAIGSDNLRLNVDSGNYYWFGYTVSETHQILESASSLAVHTHLKNETSEERETRRFPGRCTVVRLWEGDIDVAGFVRRLRDIGYRGAYSIEEEFAGMGEMTPTQLREAVSEDIQGLKRALRG